MNNLKELLSEMATAEKVIAEFYSACASAFQEHHEFWNALSLEELNHSEMITNISKAIEAHPSEFSQGRTFATIAVKTLISGVKQHTEEIKKGVISIKKAFIIANDLENSLIEFRYSEVVKSSNRKYQDILNKLSSDEAKHKLKVSSHLSH